MGFSSCDANEWFDVLREINPSLTREEFEQKWAEFQREKERREQMRKVN